MYIDADNITQHWQLTASCWKDILFLELAQLCNIWCMQVIHMRLEKLMCFVSLVCRATKAPHPSDRLYVDVVVEFWTNNFGNAHMVSQTLLNTIKFPKCNYSNFKI